MAIRRRRGKRRKVSLCLVAITVMLVMVLGQESDVPSSDAGPSEVEAEPPLDTSVSQTESELELEPTELELEPNAVGVPIAGEEEDLSEVVGPINLVRMPSSLLTPESESQSESESIATEELELNSSDTAAAAVTVSVVAVGANTEMFQDMSPLNGPSPARFQSGFSLNIAAGDLSSSDGDENGYHQPEESVECDHQRVIEILHEVELVIDQKQTYQCPVCIQYQSLGIAMGAGCNSQNGGEEAPGMRTASYRVCDYSPVVVKLKEIDTLLNEDENYAKCSPCGTTYHGSQPGLHWGIAPSNAAKPS
eukprot:CAMPEP_0198246638 /NCGR_PEP_ID=MMETSP1446-20131203/46076_1 /TAXON_ID=1461542 ORGANISM="Unidentified sp, Strain CCMP2111" /NCGR_SAMPLE_ID=MMETSP1446 /ASSEMBLY_ACC=CAM_ASM_001112 /LENGTH=306 /DNA_ID=CAMNT_0043930961 /DNA_START=652 /DNA_END=1569 /DNA_ORIENTATION=-